MRRISCAVHLLAAAESDLNDILLYIGIDNIAAAESLANDFEKSMRHLRLHPLLGRVPNEEELIRVGYRYLVVGNYLVFYTVEPRSVLIHRIIHGARDYISVLGAPQ